MGILYFHDRIKRKSGNVFPRFHPKQCFYFHLSIQKHKRLKLDMRFYNRADDTRPLGHTHRPENNWIMRNWTSYEAGLCVEPTNATYHPWKYLSRATVLWTQQIHVVISYIQKTAWYSAWTQWFRVASDEQRTFLYSASYYLYMNTENVCACVFREV